jgi:hypothetical protein
VTAVPNPNVPAYPSEVATLSAAAAEVMSELFPRERDTFESQADEAAMSRLWAGLQFRHDTEQGLILGRSIGERAAARMQGDDVTALAADR